MRGSPLRHLPSLRASVQASVCNLKIRAVDFLSFLLKIRAEDSKSEISPVSMPTSLNSPPEGSNTLVLAYALILVNNSVLQENEYKKLRINSRIAEDGCGKTVKVLMINSTSGHGLLFPKREFRGNLLQASLGSNNHTSYM
ncbi:hypothetical protein ACS0TY_035086 [Phlomoides rotata]